MADYKSNSHKSKEGKTVKKEIKKVATGKTRKQSSISKLSDMIRQDSKGIGEHIVMDLLIPAGKKLLTDTLDMMLYGEVRDNRSRKKSGSRVSYGDYYRYRDEPRRPSHSYSYDQVYLDTRGEAEEVLDGMENIIDKYDQVSIADMYDLCDITGDYTDNKYGWRTLRGAYIEKTREGDYTIKLPRPIVLD